jgi:hypothetical protein
MMLFASIAPAVCATTRPALNRKRLGIPRTPSSRATSCSSSELSFKSRTFGSSSCAARSKFGAIVRHGPTRAPRRRRGQRYHCCADASQIAPHRLELDGLRTGLDGRRRIAPRPSACPLARDWLPRNAGRQYALSSCLSRLLLQQFKSSAALHFVQMQCLHDHPLVEGLAFAATNLVHKIFLEGDFGVMHPMSLR